MRVATGLMAGFTYLPLTARLAIDTLVVLAGANLLQFGYSWLQEQEHEP
jgi:pantothenate kinase-related protein Tda10